MRAGSTAGQTILICDASMPSVVSHIGAFFFFQAEDGIRDYKVTGVQTCALPISPAPATRSAPAIRLAGAGGGLWRKSSARRCGTSGRALFLSGDLPDRADQVVRSEERRVGKECRSRWSPYH